MTRMSSTDERPIMRAGFSMRTREEIHAYFDLIGLPRIADDRLGWYAFIDGTAAWVPVGPPTEEERSLYARGSGSFRFREGRLYRSFGLVGWTEDAIVGTPNVPREGWVVRDAGAVPLDMIVTLEIPASELLRIFEERGKPY